jgi:predicted permease
MRFLKRSFNRLLNFLTRRRADKRFREEVESHLRTLSEENIRAGMPREEARRQASLKFGAVEAIRQDYHAEESLPLLEDLLLDIRYSFRILRRSPAFTLVVVLTLMLGIGANIAVFGVVNAVLLRPLDVTDPQGLYELRLKPWTSFKLATTSYPAFEDLQRRNVTFSEMTAFAGYIQARLTAPSVVRRVNGHAVSGNYFDLLGVQPQVGRFFHAGDEHGLNSAPYVVLSNDLWRSAFNGDSRVVGTTVRLDNDTFTVTGVAPAQFHGTEQFVWPDYWIPLVNWGLQGVLENRANQLVTVIGRLKPGVTPQQAAENLSALKAQLAKEYPRTDIDVPMRLVRPGLYADNGDVIRGFVYIVTGLTLLVLIAACANLASLFAARAADRARELALRVAVGASRWQLVRQLLAESMVVSLLGGAGGFTIAHVLLDLLNRWQSPYGHVAVTVDTRVFVVAIALTLISGMFFGMIPARQVWRSHPLQAMKGAAEAAPMSRVTLRDLMLGTQITVCMLLIAASLVAVRGMVRILKMPLGFRPQGVMLAEVDPSLVEPDHDLPLQRKKAMIDAARNIPGVTAVGTVNRVPFTGGLRGVPVFHPGAADFSVKNAMLSPYVFIMSPGYLDAAGTRLVSGRGFSWSDTVETPRVAIVNETFARQMWGETPAIGQRFIVRERLTEVIGLVEDGKYHNLQEEPQAVAYLSLSQNERGSIILVVRSQRSQNEMAVALDQTLTGFEPNAQIKVQSWYDVLGGVNALFPVRAATVAVGVMGSLAAMLAVTGIFGMAAYNVSRRMKELGVRAALGARARHMISAAVGRPIVILGGGSFLGMLFGIFGGRLLSRIVYQANPRDPGVLCGAVLIMALLGVVASALPAVRALAIDPCKLLREQ